MRRSPVRAPQAGEAPPARGNSGEAPSRAATLTLAILPRAATLARHRLARRKSDSRNTGAHTIQVPLKPRGKSSIHPCRPLHKAGFFLRSAENMIPGISFASKSISAALTAIYSPRYPCSPRHQRLEERPAELWDRPLFERIVCSPSMAEIVATERSNGLRPIALLIGLAANHSGLLTRKQLLDAGLTRNFIDGRVKCGLLRRAHAGVYQFGPVSPSYTRERAALLACNGGVIGHQSAVALWQVLPAQRAPDPVDVVLCTQRHRGVRPGIRVHRCVPADDEITAFEGVPVTTLARTLLDIGTMSARDVERAIGVGERLQSDLRDKLTVLLARYPKRRGTGTLRTLLADPSSGTFTRSQAEEELLELIRSAGLPMPEMNVMLHGFEVDWFWRDARLVVEVDGYAFHGSHRAFGRDRRRDSVMIAAGMRVLRLTWRQLTRERDRTLAQLAQALVVRPDHR
jgi:very-short-patch-repair endonuclease